MLLPVASESADLNHDAVMSRPQTGTRCSPRRVGDERPHRRTTTVSRLSSSLAAMSSSLRRTVTVAATGVLVGVAAAFLAAWQLATLVGWFAAATVFLVSVWVTIGRADGPETQRLSTAEDDTRAERGVLVVAASVVSLAGAGMALHKASQLDGGIEPALLTVAALATVIVSWLAVHTDFTLRYAHLYYVAPVGGIDFPGADLPDYRDFAYLSFTVGMTYQVSDTGLLACASGGFCWRTRCCRICSAS